MAGTGLETRDALVDVRGGRIAVRQWRPSLGSGTAPIVLLHDSLGSVDQWREFPETLARTLRRPVVAYDRLGHGRSSERRDVPSVGSIRREAEVCFPALRRALGLGEFILFGHSIGGVMSLLIASGDADCRAVISESAQAFIEDRTLAGVRQAKEQFEDPAQLDRLKRWHGDKAESVLGAWTGLWLSPHVAGWTLEPDLPRVRCPVLAIHGDRDEFGSVRSPELICRTVAGPAELCILEDCGHVPHREKSDAVLERVAAFLGRHVPPGA